MNAINNHQPSSTNPSPTAPHPPTAASKYIPGVNACLAPLFCISLTCSLHSLWLATASFFWKSRNEGCRSDAFWMNFKSTYNDHKPSSTNILPPKPPASSTCTRQNYSLCQDMSGTPVCLGLNTLCNSFQNQRYQGPPVIAGAMIKHGFRTW